MDSHCRPLKVFLYILSQNVNRKRFIHSTMSTAILSCCVLDRHNFGNIDKVVHKQQCYCKTTSRCNSRYVLTNCIKPTMIYYVRRKVIEVFNITQLVLFWPV